MEITLPLDKMSIDDKIRTMESIWENLCQNADSLTSPDWHKKILKLREDEIANGNDKFEDWDKTKKSIRDSIS